MRTKIGLCLIIKSKYVLFDFDDDDLRSALFSFRFRFFVFFYSNANLHGFVFVFFLSILNRYGLSPFSQYYFFLAINTFSFDTKLRSDFDIVYLPNFLSKRFCSRILSREIFHFLNCFPLLFFRFFCRRRRFFCKKEKKSRIETIVI